ncbi:MAG: HAMP domain-containing sensor histidine kinase [Thermoleophilia bacterium]
MPFVALYMALTRTREPLERYSAPVLALVMIALIVAVTLRDRAERVNAAAERRRGDALNESLEASRRELARQNQELRALLATRAAEQERIETLYRVGQRLAGEMEPPAIARIGLAGLCALGGASGGVIRLTGDAAAITFGDCPAELAEQAEVSGGVRVEGAPWGATVRVPITGSGKVLASAYLALPEIAGIAELDGPAISHLAAQISVALEHAGAYQAARRQAGIVRSVLDATPDAIHLVDARGGIVISNEPFRQTIVPALGLLGGMDARGPGDIPAVADPGAFLQDVSTVRADPDVPVVHEFTVAETGATFVRYTAPVRDRAGTLIGRLFVHREVTSEREADRLKDEFLALVSHELRTPLTSVIGYLELVLDGEAGATTTEQERFLGIAERNARRLLRLVGDLLVVAQAEAGRLGLTPETFDMAALAADQLEAVRPVADAAGVCVRLDVVDPAPVDGDRERLGQILDNLLTNAVRYSGAGGVVRLSIVDDGECVEARVTDSGPGIPPDELPHVFKRFFRGAAAAPVSGTGLGLSICKLIAEGHGGTMEALSPPGEGATFRLRLPRSEVRREASRVATPGERLAHS